jgi:hypothetical protein
MKAIYFSKTSGFLWTTHYNPERKAELPQRTYFLNIFFIPPWLRLLFIYDINLSSVHCAGLLDVRRAFQNMLSADRQTEGHSFGDHLISESVSVNAIECYRSFFLLCSVLCRYGSCEIQFRTEFSLIIAMWKEKLVQTVQKKFRRKFPDTCPSGDIISKLVKKVRTNGR